MKKTLTLIALLLLALAACSAPAPESVSNALPGSDEPVPAQVVTPAETNAAAGDPTAEAVATCEVADIPAPAEGRVMLRFLNLSGTELTGVWHDTIQSPSVLTEYFQLANDQSFDQETFAGHEWLLMDEEDDMLLDYVASDQAQQCVVIYPHFAYEGEAAPENWAELSDHYEMCGRGLEQSPIDLAGATLTDLENIIIDYGETAVNIINNGHTIQVKVDDGSQITIDGETYALAQFHFHAPSEHTIDGRAYPIELHLVHQAANKALAVLGVMIAEGAENTSFTPVWDHLPEEESGFNATGATVQLAGLLPTEQTVYRYDGSLTTPPCSEDVLWSVMSTPVELSAEQIAAFRDIIDGNNRPLQPPNDRLLEFDQTP